jgi:ribonuclease R/exosome complex exonuclease DIS3/RRP44
LRPNEDKLCFSAIFKLDSDGHVLEEWFGRTVINSNVRLTYEEAQTIIESPFTSIQGNKIFYAIKDLNTLAKKMRTERMTKGSISFEKQEVRFKLDEKNKPTEIIFKVAKDSNKLIEEFMLLANRKVAKFINDKKYPMVNRGHDRPNEEKLVSLKEFIKQFGYEITIDTPANTTRTLNKLLTDVQGKAEANMIENLVVRTMQKANYTTVNVGHYGLGFKDYTHFTSPIRRYPDVMVHRLLGRYLDEKSAPKIEKLESKCMYLSQREKLAQKAERESIKFMQCVYMNERVGKVYDGIINSIQDYGLFIEIPENHCEGFIRLSEIGGDTFVADIDNHCLKGFNTGEVIRLGDKVKIVVKSVDIERKNINLTLIRE